MKFLTLGFQECTLPVKIEYCLDLGDQTWIEDIILKDSIRKSFEFDHNQLMVLHLSTDHDELLIDRKINYDTLIEIKVNEKSKIEVLYNREN